MLDINRSVTACGQPNFRGAHLPLPSNFDFHEWSAIAHTQADQEVLQYLKYGFPAGFEGPIPTPSFGNHSSAVNHPRDVKAYITISCQREPCWAPSLDPPSPPGARPTLSSPVPSATHQTDGSLCIYDSSIQTAHKLSGPSIGLCNVSCCSLAFLS